MLYFLFILAPWNPPPVSAVPGEHGQSHGEDVLPGAPGARALPARARGGLARLPLAQDGDHRLPGTPISESMLPTEKEFLDPLQQKKRDQWHHDCLYKFLSYTANKI